MEYHQVCKMGPEEMEYWRNEDKKWIENWLSYKNVLLGQKLNSAVKVSDLQDYFQGILGGFYQLEQQLQLLSSKHKTMTASEWNQQWKEFADKQKDLTQLLQILEDTEQFKPLLQSVQKVKKKRLRKRKHLSELKERRKAQSARLNNKIDGWRANIVRQEEKKKREKEFQAEADEALSEVTTKKTEVQRLQKLVSALSKLHKVRRESATYHTAQQGDEQFYKIIASLQDALSSRLKEYVAEERAIRVMLEVQEEERREKDHCDAESEFAAVLFGDSKFSTTDPLYPFHSLFTRASHDLESFVDCRRSWDQFVNKDGSAIPVGWVLPSEPSSALWAAAVKGSGRNSKAT